jgi:hypothetical protein
MGVITRACRHKSELAVNNGAIPTFNFRVDNKSFLRKNIFFSFELSLNSEFEHIRLVPLANIPLHQPSLL